MQTLIKFNQIKVGDLIFTNGSKGLLRKEFVCGTVSCIHFGYLCLKNYRCFDLSEIPNSDKLDGFNNRGSGCNGAWQTDNFLDTKYYKITNGNNYMSFTGINEMPIYVKSNNKQNKKVFNKEQRTLYKAGYITECFDLTIEGQAELNAIVREKFMEELIKSAKEKIAEEEYKAK